MFSRFHDCTISGLPYCASDSPTRTNERRSKQKLTEGSYITYMEIAMFTLQALKSQSLLRGISSERIKHLCHLLDRAAVDLDQQQHGLCQASSLTDRFLPVQSPALSFVRKCAWDQKARVTFQINMFGSSRAGNEGDRRAPGLFELNENMADFHLYMHCTENPLHEITILREPSYCSFLVPSNRDTVNQTCSSRCNIYV